LFLYIINISIQSTNLISTRVAFLVEPPSPLVYRQYLAIIIASGRLDTSIWSFGPDREFRIFEICRTHYYAAKKPLCTYLKNIPCNRYSRETIFHHFYDKLLLFHKKFLFLLLADRFPKQYHTVIFTNHH
jgi:hypothetical protein